MPDRDEPWFARFIRDRKHVRHDRSVRANAFLDSRPPHNTSVNQHDCLAADIHWDAGYALMKGRPLIGAADISEAKILSSGMQVVMTHVPGEHPHHAEIRGWNMEDSEEGKHARKEVAHTLAENSIFVDVPSDLTSACTCQAMDIKPLMKISVVTACFNAAKTLSQALESVRAQVLPEGVELEHIVVDGGSTDGTVELLRDCAARYFGAMAAQSRGGAPVAPERMVATSDSGATRASPLLSAHPAPITFRWVSEKDRGLYDAINKGIRMATGEVVGICNADDIMADDHVVAKLAEAFVQGGDELDAVYADIRFVRAGDSVEALREAPTARYCTGRYFRNWMFRFATFPAHPSTFVRKACFEKFGYYSLDYRICADFELMLRFFYINKIRAKYLPFCTHVMRLGGLSTGGFKSNVQINREDLRALSSHGVWSCLPLIYLKYLFKIWGFLLRR